MSTTLAQHRAYILKQGWHDTTEAQQDFFINDTRWQLADHYDWPFYRKTHYFNLTAPYTTGTVNVAEGSTTVTGAGSADFSAGMAGQLFYTGSDGGRAYQIASVAASANTLTLQSAYLGDDADGVTYAIRYVKYSLPTRHRRTTWMRLEDDNDFRLHDGLDGWQHEVMTTRVTTSTPVDCWIETESDAAGYYIADAPSEAKQVRAVYYVQPVELTDASSGEDTDDWPDKYRYLLHYALRWRQNHDLASVAGMAEADRQWKEMLATAMAASRPTDAPIRANPAGRAKMTPSEATSCINIITS